MGGTRVKAIVLGVALQLAAPALHAQGGSPQGAAQYVPAAPLGPVSDFANVVDASSRAAMDDLLTRLITATDSDGNTGSDSITLEFKVAFGDNGTLTIHGITNLNASDWVFV